MRFTPHGFANPERPKPLVTDVVDLINHVRGSLGLHPLAAQEVVRLARGVDHHGISYVDHDDQTAHLEYTLAPLLDPCELGDHAQRQLDLESAVAEYERRLVTELRNARALENERDYLQAAWSYLAAHEPEQALRVLQLLDMDSRHSDTKGLLRLISDQMNTGPSSAAMS